MPRRKSRITWEEFWRGAGVDPAPAHPLSFKKKSKRRRKRFRPEKIISVKEFLTGEHKTKEDLPMELDILSDPKKRKKIEPKISTTNGLTRKYLGNGRIPRWMNCPEKEANEKDA